MTPLDKMQPDHEVIPSIAPEVEKLIVLQRTPIWCLPKPDGRIGPRARRLLGRVPGAQVAARALSQTYVELNFPIPAHFHGVVPIATAAERIGLRHLRRQVRDPAVREKLTPRYGLGCKRPSFSNEYLATFNRPNVQLETAPIEAITASGVRTVDGGEYDIDALILATGFQVFDKGNMPAFAVHGSDGVELAEWWDENRFQAYEGVSVPSFPGATSRRCWPAATARCSSRTAARPRTAITSTLMATRRSAPRQHSRQLGAVHTSTSTTTGSRESDSSIGCLSAAVFSLSLSARPL